MAVVHEVAASAPHLPQIKTPSWPSPYHPHDYPSFTSSPTPVSPGSLHSSTPHKLESPGPLQNMNTLPTSAWYAPAALTSECPIQAGYTLCDPYAPPLTSSITLSPPTPTLPFAGTLPMPLAQANPLLTAFSPVSAYSRDSVIPESRRPSEEPLQDSSCVGEVPSTHPSIGSHSMNRPHSSPNLPQPNPVEAPWAANSLGIDIPPIHNNPYYPTFPSLTRNACLSEPLIELSSNHLVSPQPRRLWTPIAPQPLERLKSSGVKRSREKDQETTDDDAKRRKRSNSNASQQPELSEEDKLLLQLKEEEAMPWKEIAARFQSDLGKTYQIPALQMRLKRLRERMRVWTEVDLNALRMANKYWSQHRFDIIAQKMVDFGAQEKWTPRQCLHKCMEMNPSSQPYGPYKAYSHHDYSSSLASPIKQPSTFLQYKHVQ